MPNPDFAYPPAVLDIDAAARYVSLSTAALRRLVAAGTFPKPRLLSRRRVGWRRAELDQWTDNLAVSDVLPVGSSE